VARRRWAASRRARIRLTELKRGETIAPHRGQGRPDRDLPGRREPQRLQADPPDDRVDPDQATDADQEAATRALPRPRLRLRRGTRARSRVRLHRPHPRPRRRSARDQTRGRLPRSSLGRRAHPLLAESLPPHPHPLGETRRHLPRNAPPRLRTDQLARRRLDTPTGIGSKPRRLIWAEASGCCDPTRRRERRPEGVRSP